MKLFLTLIIIIFCFGKSFSQTKLPDKISVEKKKTTISDYKPTFLDTLNKGNEISLRKEDFGIENISKSVSLKPLDTSNATFTFVYQVQFFTTTKLEDAEKEKKRIEETMSIPVFLISEPPYYKLRAGKFSARVQAEDCKTKMIDIGHSQAWIVQTKKQ